MRKAPTTVTIAAPHIHSLPGLAGMSPSEFHEGQPLGEKLVFQLLTLDEDPAPPYAAIAALGHGLQGQEGYWLHLDPVELQVDAGNIYLLGRDHLGLEDSESQQLIADLNQLISEDGLTIQQGSESQWYIRLLQAPALITTPLSEVVGKDIRQDMPTGQDSAGWRKLITEIQMLLFQHKINEIRQAANQPVINSVWLWGEGELNRFYNRSSYGPVKYRVIWHDNAFARGMLLCMGSLDSQYQLDEFSSSAIKEPGNYLTILNHDYDEASLVKTLSELIAAVSSAKITQLTLYLGGKRYIWRRNLFKTLCKWFKLN